MATENLNLDVTTVSATVSFSSPCYYAEIYNAGSNRVYVNINALATTDHFPIDAGETIRIFANVVDVRGITTTSTSRLNIIGTR